MKKILSITMMMVAMMVATFSFVSCSSDDDNTNQYKLDISLNISERGNLTQEECQELIFQAAQKSGVLANYKSDAEAKAATGEAAQAMAHGLEETKAEFGDAVFSYTFKCTKVSTGAQVITYYVDFSKGDINCYNNEN